MSEITYRLTVNGDQLEKDYWPLFIEDEFPSYEKFWLKFVAPLTNRPDNINFKTNEELVVLGKSEANLCVAQLNYSTLRHLIRCFRVKELLTDTFGMDKIDQQLDLLLEGLTRLVGAQDNAFELLERIKNPNKYIHFTEKPGDKARKNWKNDNNFPLQPIRDYRNSLVHGRLLPGIMDGQRLCLPAIGKVESYLDWRLITQPSSQTEEYKKDFISVLTILESAWKETIGYLENNWGNL